VAQQFWLLSRHGSRNPSTEEMLTLKSILPLIQNEIISNHKAGKGSLCKDDIENLEKWIFRANVNDDEFLVKEGFKELEDIADRYQDRFPKLLTKPFINSSYIVCSKLKLRIFHFFYNML
jgi:multiple inositol-polyphosphate phosphatase/2,3-bisphosphoglycerate 3-phosphatase